MADDNKTATGNEPNTDTQTDDGVQNDKKYTDADLNNISKKNSEKAVTKLLKELGITDKEKAKQILARAAEEEKAAAGTADSEANALLTSQLAEARQQANNAVPKPYKTNCFASHIVKQIGNGCLTAGNKDAVRGDFLVDMGFAGASRT